jgi:hypothetical protein
VSGSKDRRPALDRLVTDAKRRKFDVLVCWRLDRLGRNLKHLITLLEKLQALGVAFVSLAEGIDATTPAGKLQMHILGAIAEFERGRIVERVRAGLSRARAQGRRLGRPRRTPARILVPGRRRARGRAHLGRVEVNGRAVDQRGPAGRRGTNPRGSVAVFAPHLLHFARAAVTGTNGCFLGSRPPVDYGSTA